MVCSQWSVWFRFLFLSRYSAFYPRFMLPRSLPTPARPNIARCWNSHIGRLPILLCCTCRSSLCVFCKPLRKAPYSIPSIL